MTDEILQTLVPYQGNVWDPEEFLTANIPKHLHQFLKYAWSLKLPIAIAGSSASFSIGLVKHFQDIDVFLTTDVLR